jgi:hypothetical protein
VADGFIDGRWRPLIVDSSRGRLDRHPYELCAAFELRTALRAGRVCVPGSRRHQDPASYLLPDERWQTIRAELARTSGQPVDIDERLRHLADEQARLVRRLETAADCEAE